MNLVVPVNKEMGYYKWYVGRAFTTLPDRLEAMKKESNFINDAVKSTAHTIKFDQDLLIEFKRYILQLSKKELSILDSFNIKYNSLGEKDDISTIIKEEENRGRLLTQKILDATADGIEKVQLINYLTSKSFLDKIAKKGSMMSFTLVGGGTDYTVSNKSQRAAGKSKVEKILLNAFQNKQTGSKELLNFLLGDISDENLSQSEEECINLLIEVIDEQVNNTYKQMMIKKGTKLTTSEKKIKTWFKQLSKRLVQQANKNLKEEQQQLNLGIQNLIKGQLIPTNSTFALQLNDYINDTKGLYQDYIHGVFYTEDDKKREQVSVEQLSQQLFLLIYDTITDTGLKKWLSDEQNKKNIINIFINAWGEKKLNTDFDAYDKSNISNVCGIVATTLLFSNISKGKTNIKIRDELNELKQLSATDMDLTIAGKIYGIQIKNYTSIGNTITLYDDTNFSLMGETASKYISEDILKCIRFLLINSAILRSKMGIKVDRKAIEAVLMLELSTFLRIDDYKAESTFNQNSFFVVNGTVLSSAYILCIAYQRALELLKMGQIDNLFEILGNATTDKVNNDADIEMYRTIEHDPFMFNSRGRTILVKNEGWYPRQIETGKENLAQNLSISFKGIKVKF